MKDDLLERAVASYRDQTGNAGDQSDAVLERIQRSRRMTHLVGRKRRRALAVALAAALATAGAWAGVSKRLPALVARVAAFVRIDDSKEAPVTKPAVSRHVPVEPAVPAASIGVPATAPGAPDVEAPTKETHGNPTVSSRRHATEPAPTMPVVAAAPDVDALYRAAHDQHFKAHDYVAALSAWNAYLAAAGPGSGMLIEARYNRGIALARLGRRDEAVAALRPFADGEYGEYRKTEARRLIEKLEQ